MENFYYIVRSIFSFSMTIRFETINFEAIPINPTPSLSFSTMNI